MRATLVQFESSVDSAVNRARIAELLGGLEPGSVDLVVLPEASMRDFGSTSDDLAEVAEPVDGPFFEALSAEAKRLGVTVVAGMFEAVADGLPYNTLMVIGRNGQLQATYRKIHLYDSFGYRESDRLSSGPIAPLVVEVAGTRVGLMTCYDLRFPELARLLVDQGAEALLVPAAWVAGDRKVEHWRTLATARAIEGTVFVLAVGQCGPRYTGHSIAVDPMGQILAEAGDSDDLLTVDIDPDTVAAARDANPSLANRRIR